MTGTAESARIGFVQTRPAFGDVEGNLRRAGQHIDSMPPFDLLVLPELFSTGYVFRDRAELLRLAQDLRGSTVEFLRDRAARHGAWICGGFAERDGDRVFNSAALAGPDGTLHVYRKIHLFDRETLTFDPGDRPFRAETIVLPGGTVRVGMLVCFDWFFPESARSLALDGAEILLHPSNLVLTHCQDAMKTRCLENSVFAVTANRTGEDDRGDGLRLAFTGASQVAAPRGRILHRASAEGEACHVEVVDLREARSKTITERNDLLGDRRPDLYRNG